MEAPGIALVFVSGPKDSEELAALSSKKRACNPAAFSTPHTMHMRLTFCAPRTL